MFWKYSVILLVIQLCELFFKIKGATDCQSAAQNCSQCISKSHQCFWCEDKDFGHQNKRSRCDTQENLLDLKCNINKIVGDDNRNPRAELITNRPFSNKTYNTIQLKPQKVKISLRAGSRVTIDINYKRAEDYPMDLYYLMDLSCTMLQHKTILGSVGQKLAESLKMATSNFKIGFGSFVDKPIMPFSAFNIEPVKCISKGLNAEGEPPYSYTHKQKLTSNSAEFIREVINSKTSGNVDSPEGTLDALMQVLTCGDVIGWRNQSNKIIVVATDAEFHYAGDGKLGGIITPNDGECHMVDNKYTNYNLTDYPSMYHIAEKAHGFNIVFSVSKEVKPVYDRLSSIIGANARVALLEDNDDRAVKIIKETYDSIRSRVELTVKRKPKFIDVQFYSECQTGVRTETSSCSYKDIREIKFEAVITLNACPKDWKGVKEIWIGLPNNVNEVLKIDLEMLCGCDCDERVEPNAQHCKHNGTLACGICRECNGKRTGPTCDCDPEKPIDPKDPERYCKNPNRTTICSNRGKCECNKCDCIGTGYQGEYCEIDESGCYPNSDKSQNLCNGNGLCVNGKCQCKTGYTGQLCHCTSSNNTCIRNGQECSGQGKCVCGECKCQESTTWGRFCQFCPSCDKHIYCNESRECVSQICETYYGSKENCTQECTFNLIPVASFDELDNSTSKKAYRTQCIFQTLDDECGVEFSYGRIDDELTNKRTFSVTNATRICKEKLNLVVVSGSVIAGTLLLGLALLLIWKLLTEIWDRKEYARFQKELSKVNWEESENPLYKEAKSTFTNPMFNLRERAQKRLSRITERFSRRFDANH